jgi:hypothetical protein
VCPLAGHLIFSIAIERMRRVNTLVCCVSFVAVHCWRSAQRWLTSISAAITSAQAGQRALQECCDSAGSWSASISGTMASKQTRQRGFELRGVVKPLVFVYRHLALLALCHLFSRQTKRKSDSVHIQHGSLRRLRLVIARPL